MLIRSQNRKCIVNLRNIDTLTVQETIAGYQITAFNVESHILLGNYSKERKAIEVLDMIESYNAIIDLINIGKSFSEDILEKYREMTFGCFKMPADDEVQA